MSLQPRVARGVRAGRLAGQVLLARRPRRRRPRRGRARCTRAAQVRQEAVLAVELERHLGDQHVVGVVLGQRRVAGDEAGVAAHQLHQPDAAGRRARLDVRGADRLGRLRERGPEAEAVVDERDVVVDRLRARRRPRSAAPRSAITSAICCAPRSEPSPPMTNRMLMPSCSRQSTISSGSCCPREVPRIVPPSSLMSRTTSGVEVDHRVPVAGDEALVAVAEAR